MKSFGGTARAGLIGALLLSTWGCAHTAGRGPAVRKSAPPAPVYGVSVSPSETATEMATGPVPETQLAAHPALLEPRVPGPDFALPDAAGTPFALGELRGQWVVLHLYPRSDTPDCACDATAFTEHLWRFGSLETEVVCVTSESPPVAAKFAKKYGLTVTLIPDPLCSVPRAAGAFDSAKADPVVRTTLVVDPDGLVAARWDRVTDPEHIEDVLRVLEMLGQDEAPQF